LTKHRSDAILGSQAGVKHPAQNTSLKPLLFEFIMFNFTSSAIESISDVQDGKVTITFVGGREYTYAVPQVDQFVSELTKTINNDGSVGRFVNNAIKSEQLVAA
jgi:hypothetical protein